MMGITRVRITQYAFGGLGMIPGTIVYVYFGTTISNISDAASGNFDGGVLQLVLLIAGSVLAIIGVWYVSYVARKEVKKVLKRQEEEKAEKEKEEGEANDPEKQGENNEANQDENSKVQDGEAAQNEVQQLQTVNVEA